MYGSAYISCMLYYDHENDHGPSLAGMENMALVP